MCVRILTAFPLWDGHAIISSAASLPAAKIPTQRVLLALPSHTGKLGLQEYLASVSMETSSETGWREKKGVCGKAEMKYERKMRGQIE